MKVSKLQILMKSVIYLSLIWIGLQVPVAARFKFQMPLRRLLDCQTNCSYFPDQLVGHRNRSADEQQRLFFTSGKSEESWHCIVPSNAAFAFMLYKQVALDAADKNVFFSPLSISASLAMLALGAKSDTQRQMYEGLAFNLSEIGERDINRGFQDAIDRIDKWVVMGNALFLDETLNIVDNFAEDIKTFYKAEHFSTDFLNITNAEKQINDYLKSKTGGIIQDSVSNLSEKTQMVVINYIYFQGVKFQMPLRRLLNCQTNCSYFPDQLVGHRNRSADEQQRLFFTLGKSEESWHFIVPSNAAFAFMLYKQVALDAADKNVFFSPLSISTSLAMLALGAKSDTQRQMYEGLAFNLSEIEERDINRGFQDAIDRIDKWVVMGNALFLDETLNIVDNFAEDIKTFYKAEHFSTDFLNITNAEKQINDYLKSKTGGIIQDSVSNLSEKTQMVVINYIYFQGELEINFNPRLTHKAHFTAYGNTTIEVDMMTKMSMFQFLYDTDLSCSVVELSFSEDSRVWFILPDEGKLNHVEQTWTEGTLSEWSTSFETKSLQLCLPKFTISMSHDFKDALISLGMTDLFSKNADLSGITGKRDLCASQAFQKAMLVVQENEISPQGRRVIPTEARRSSSKEYHPVVFNRPFLIVILDKATQSILFLGRIENPTEPPSQHPVHTKMYFSHH